jgi:peptidoglycan/LPS O-acetylase OafA/YrhL
LFACARRLGLPPLPPGPLRFAVSFTGTLVAASLSWYLMERPINDLKRYFPYKPRRIEDSGDIRIKTRLELGTGTVETVEASVPTWKNV